MMQEDRELRQCETAPCLRATACGVVGWWNNDGEGGQEGAESEREWKQ